MWDVHAQICRVHQQVLQLCLFNSCVISHLKYLSENLVKIILNFQGAVDQLFSKRHAQIQEGNDLWHSCRKRPINLRLFREGLKKNGKKYCLLLTHYLTCAFHYATTLLLMIEFDLIIYMHHATLMIQFLCIIPDPDCPDFGYNLWNRCLSWVPQKRFSKQYVFAIRLG